MSIPLWLLLLVVATGQELQTTAADVGRCINSNAEKLSESNDSVIIVADKVVVACNRLIGQWAAARDALVAKESGPVPPSNSAGFRRAAIDGFKQAALLSVQRARQNR